MKRILMPLLLFAVILVSCGKKTNPSVIIAGKALNYTDSLLFITLDGEKDTIRLNADGTFEKEITVEKACYPNFQGNRIFAYLWLYPGKTLTIDFDAADFRNTLVFGGDLGLPNTYLNEKTKISSAHNQAINAGYRPPNMAEDFKRICDSIFDLEVAFFNEFKTSHPDLDTTFVTMETLATRFSYLSYLQNFPSRIYYYNDQATVPDNWFDFMKGLNLDDPTLLGIPDAKYFIIGQVNDQALKKSGVKPEESWGNIDLLRAIFSEVDLGFKNPEVVDVLLFEKLKQHLDAEGNNGISDLVDKYLSLAVNEKNRKTIEDINTQWNGIATGKPAPAFTVLDKEGGEHQLSDFAGKFVFIDFWATWCGPCKVEIPFLKQLYEDYKEKNLVIMSISVDKEKQKWVDMVTQEGFEWLQFHDGVNMNDLYMVRYIPTFVLIGPDGNIVNPRAPKPSDEALRELLNGLLD